MRKLIVIALAVIAAVFSVSVLYAQTAALTAPKTYATASNIFVREFAVNDRSQSATVTIDYTTDATGTVTRETQQFSIPANPAAPGTEYTDFLTAIGTTATGETGGVRRRANFRIVHYLCTTSTRIQCASETP